MRMGTSSQKSNGWHALSGRSALAFLLYFSCFIPLSAFGHERDKRPADIDSTICPEEASRLLSAYIQYPSVTGNEKPAGEFFSGLCRERGLNVKVFTDFADSYNFAASLYPLQSGKPNIILLSHIDVVSESDLSEWREGPFSGAIIEDTIWGRGTIDMKGMAIMQLLAISAYVQKAQESDLPVNVTLLGVSGEENYGTMGARIICDSFLRELNPVVVLGEGGVGSRDILTKSKERPVFCISVSDKRALWVELHIDFPTSGHGSVPPPEYANKMMINALSSLTHLKPKIYFNSQTRDMFRAYGAMEKGLTGFMIKHPVIFKPLISIKVRRDPLLLATVTNTMTVTHFDGQDYDINQVPQESSVVLDCRLLPGTMTAEFLDFLHSEINNSAVEIRVLRETQHAPATVPDMFLPILEEAVKETYPGSGMMTILFPATTDNNYFRNRGIPVYGLNPVIMDQELMKTVHNYNERIPVECLTRGTEVYMRFIGKLLSDPQDLLHVISEDHPGFPDR